MRSISAVPLLDRLEIEQGYKKDNRRKQNSKPSIFVLCFGMAFANETKKKVKGHKRESRGTEMTRLYQTNCIKLLIAYRQKCQRKTLRSMPTLRWGKVMGEENLSVHIPIQLPIRRANPF